jgi:2-oxo-4-hydroxy-4-carboxy-5-ureidoimidazoline decarboxylase
MESWRLLNEADPATAQALLRRCCGSLRWVERMIERRPFGSEAALLAAAREEWLSLGEADWLEAFAHHPRIGDRDSLRARFPETHQLSAQEQAGVAAAGSDVLSALALANREYEARFGFIFIVCASGKRADEMLELLRNRLNNDRDAELRTAAEEQAKITALRLRSLQ